jgi:hypothetical protein
MIKRINVFPLAEDSDPEEVWKYWVDKHAESIKLTPGVNTRKTFYTKLYTEKLP